MHAFLAIATVVSGLQGFVYKGPTAPVCRVGEPCAAPAQVTLLFRRAVLRDGELVVLAGSRAARARSDGKGHYRVVLEPGYYTVTTLERIAITRNIHPRAVHVRRAHVDRLDFSIDTGIR